MSRLYLEHFGLHRPPFNITPDPSAFFAGAQRGALREAIEHAVLDTPGIVLVVGEVGSGKTMLCRLLAQRLQARACDLIYLANPAFAPQEILRSMLADLGEDAGGDAPLLRLQQALLARHQRGRSVVLLIDEAQAMPPASMEEIKLLSNLETAQHKLLQIVLFGQPEIEATLTVPQLRQVRDRVVNRFVIPPLNIEDARRYVEHRLACAGSGGRTLFEENALLLLARLGHGSLRRLHILADQALLAAFADGSTCVRTPHVRKAALSLPYPDHARRWRTPA
ncbi:MAG: ExeA family protein, partial [Tepidimonas sp.]|uniref:ExeA family protein n=1 Tax=Tepidimonas sp. TaxID=2002775 RepID=UPI004054F04C